MKKTMLVLCVAAATSLASTARADHAAEAQAAISHGAPVVTVDCQPCARVKHRCCHRQKRSFFGELMELERRKNAWLLHTFFGI